MTNELIPLTVAIIGNEEQKTVNARDLHAFLEVGKDFSNWIKDKIQKYDFKEGKDYVKFSPNSAKTPNGGRPRVEYFLSVGMAKEISMVENNEKGNQARKYFLACEEELKAMRLAVDIPIPAGLPNFNDPAEAAIAWGQTKKQLQASEKKTAELTKKLELAAPKVSAYNDLVDDSGLYTTTAVAKILQMKRNELLTWAANNRAIYKQGKTWLPYAPWTEKKWAQVKIDEGNNKTTGDPYSSKTLRFTTSGVFQIHKLMKAQNLKVPEQLDLEI